MKEYPLLQYGSIGDRPTILDNDRTGVLQNRNAKQEARLKACLKKKSGRQRLLNFFRVFFGLFTRRRPTEAIKTDTNPQAKGRQ